MSPPVPEAGVWDPCVARAGSSWDFSPGRVDGRLLPVSPRGRASGCICVLSSSYKDQSPMTSGPKLVTSFYFLLLLLSRFSRVRLCATPQMAAYQAPSSLGFSRQEHWSELPFPSPVQESEKWKWSYSVVFDSLRPHRWQPTRLSCPWDSPGKNTGVGCHLLLQGIFPTQGSNPGLSHCRQTLYRLSHQDSRCSVKLVKLNEIK